MASDDVEHSVPLVGRDNAVEGEGLFPAAGKTCLALALFQDWKARFYLGRSQGQSACSVGSTYREEHRTCCNNDAYLSHQLVSSWPPVTHGGPTGLSAEGHGIEQSNAKKKRTMPLRVQQTPTHDFDSLWWGSRRVGGFEISGPSTACHWCIEPPREPFHVEASQYNLDATAVVGGKERNKQYSADNGKGEIKRAWLVGDGFHRQICQGTRLMVVVPVPGQCIKKSKDLHCNLTNPISLANVARQDGATFPLTGGTGAADGARWVPRGVGHS
ncbi:hypothetical protein EI94DRAFT_1698014 [Lactarius quietus]|nr:hypothetical protein EI94DRAFT_1698014 [Lactarius quietus]